jgi:hypothetical protein
MKKSKQKESLNELNIFSLLIFSNPLSLLKYFLDLVSFVSLISKTNNYL